MWWVEWSFTLGFIKSANNRILNIISVNEKRVRSSARRGQKKTFLNTEKQVKQIQIWGWGLTIMLILGLAQCLLNKWMNKFMVSLKTIQIFKHLGELAITLNDFLSWRRYIRCWICVCMCVCVCACVYVWTYVYKKKILDFKVFQV